MKATPFTFDGNGEAGPFYGPASIVVGDGENFDGNKIEVHLHGNVSNFKAKEISAPGEEFIQGLCGFTLVMVGAGNPVVRGMVWEG